MTTEQLINWLMNESNVFPPNAFIFGEIINKLEELERVKNENDERYGLLCTYTKELKELKRDVKRFWELLWIFKNTMWVCEEDSKPYLDEYQLLKIKLQKVGETLDRSDEK